MNAEKIRTDDSEIIIRDENNLDSSADYYDDDERLYANDWDNYFYEGTSYGNTYVDYYNDGTSSYNNNRDVYVDYYNDSGFDDDDYYSGLYSNRLYNGLYSGLYNGLYSGSSDWFDDDYDDYDYYDRDYDDYDDDYDDDDYYDDKELTLDGDTLRVGDDYEGDVWLSDYSRARVVDAEHNDHNMIITGNDHSNSIISGNGRTSLWGGGGSANTLIGGARRNYFWYEGNSRDVAVDFGVGDSSYSDVVVMSNGTYSSINRDSASITFRNSSGYYIQLQPDGYSNDDDPILFSENGNDIWKLKIAKNTSTNLTYSKDVSTFYFENSGQLIVNGSENNIWLGGEAGQNYVNVNTINGAGSSGYNNVFSGNSASNVIYGGTGYSTLWGGTGYATDTLVGGQGPEVFRIGKNEGSDVIYTNEGHDVISLYDVNLSDITHTGVEGDTIWLRFNTGTFVNLHNTSEVSSVFQLANGARYNYNRSSGQWQNA